METELVVNNVRGREVHLSLQLTALHLFSLGIFATLFADGLFRRSRYTRRHGFSLVSARN